MDRSVVIDRARIKRIVTTDDCIFNLPEYPHCITYIYDRYHLDDIRRTDRIIDLGANVGGFCIPMAKMVIPTITAVEPLFYKELMDNIKLNDVGIDVLELAVGNGDQIKIEWRGRKKVVNTAPLSKIIEYNEGCDFLKMEIEGAEWNIDVEDLDGIRRIEGQMHNIGLHRDSKLIKYLEDNYRVVYTDNTTDDNPYRSIYGRNPDYPMFHAYRRDS